MTREEEGWQKVLDEVDHWNAYWDTSEGDEYGEYHTIMVNAKDEDDESIDDYEFEQYFEGYTGKIATMICDEFNALRTKDLDDIYIIRADVIRREKFEAEER